MKKFLLFAIIFSASILCSFAAQPIPPQKLSAPKANSYVADLEYNMAHYFYYKNTAQLETIINYLSGSDYMEKNKSSKPGFQGFFMGVLHENPAAFHKLYLLMPSKPVRSILANAKEFSRDMERILDNKQNYYPESPEFLDMMWGYFYSTGDERVTNKMCQIQQNDKNALIRAAAKWSLDSNRKMYQNKIKIKACP